MGRDTSSHWFKRSGCASFALPAHGEMEPMKMISKGAKCAPAGKLQYTLSVSILKYTICERLHILSFFFEYKIYSRVQWTLLCVWHSIQVLENRMNPYGKQVLAKGSSHPCMDMYSHPARTIRHWLSPIVGWLFRESNYTAGKCLLYYTYISVAELPMPLRSHHDDFFPSPAEQICLPG